MNGLDIAKFAEGLLTEEETSKNPPQFAAPVAPDAPDVSEVIVPNDFTEGILNEGSWAKAEVSVGKRQKTVKKQPVTEQKITSFSVNEERVYKNYLVEEYKKKVSDLEELISLMENLGMVSAAGVNTVGRQGVGPMGGTKPLPKKRRSRRKSERITKFNN